MPANTQNQFKKEAITRMCIYRPFSKPHTHKPTYNKQTTNSYNSNQKKVAKFIPKIRKVKPRGKARPKLLGLSLSKYPEKKIKLVPGSKIKSQHSSGTGSGLPKGVISLTSSRRDTQFSAVLYLWLHIKVHSAFGLPQSLFTSTPFKEAPGPWPLPALSPSPSSESAGPVRPLYLWLASTLPLCVLFHRQPWPCPVRCLFLSALLSTVKTSTMQWGPMHAVSSPCPLAYIDYLEFLYNFLQLVKETVEIAFIFL